MSNPNAGSAFPIVVVSGITPQTRAIPVYAYNANTLGALPVSAGPMQPVVVIGASDLDYNGGAYHLEADIAPMPIYAPSDARGTLAGAPLAVYIVGGGFVVIGNRLLLETGSFILLETADFLLLEA